MPPTKGKLPTAREMQGQVLAALQELLQESKVETYYTEIDERVKENLKHLVAGKRFAVPSQSFYGTTFANKCAQARRALRRQGVLAMGPKKGHWRFSHVSSVKPPKPAPSKVEKFAEAAIKRLENQSVPPEAINSLRELLLDFQMPDPETQTDHDNLEVEAKAIAFILKKEKDKGWQRPENPNNPGFDLYQTQSGRKNGKKTVWCEVKSLSGKFSRVSLTHTEFKEALKRGKDYWLYIVENVGSYDPDVENADNDGPTLIKINDPAGKAERFTYRHPAWQKAAEEVIHANQEPLL